MDCFRRNFIFLHIRIREFNNLYDIKTAYTNYLNITDYSLKLSEKGRLYFSQLNERCWEENFEKHYLK